MIANMKPETATITYYGVSLVFVVVHIAGRDRTYVEACTRCGGRGVISMYAHVAGGECFRCNGAGTEADALRATGTIDEIHAIAKDEARRRAETTAKGRARIAEEDAHTEKARAAWVTGNIADLIAAMAG